MTSSQPSKKNSYITISSKSNIKPNIIIDKILQLKIVSKGKIYQFSDDLKMIKFACFDVFQSTTNVCLWNEHIDKYKHLFHKGAMVEISQFYYDAKYNTFNIHTKSKIKLISDYIVEKNNKLYVVDPKKIKQKINQTAITNYFKTGK